MQYHLLIDNYHNSICFNQRTLLGCVDQQGRLCLWGNRCVDSYLATPPEQYFATDPNPMERDEAFNVIDRNSQLVSLAIFLNAYTPFSFVSIPFLSFYLYNSFVVVSFKRFLCV